MTRVLVESSNVESIAYAPEEMILEVTYKADQHGNRGVYRWANIPADVHFDLMESTSKGRALAALTAAYGKGRRVATIDLAGVEHPAEVATS